MKNSISLVILVKIDKKQKIWWFAFVKKCYNNLCKKISQEGGNIYA